MPDAIDTLPSLRLQLPSGGELNPSEINSLVNTAINMRKLQEESRAAAIRYQGQMEYQQLVSSGMDASEALRRTLHKISYGSPSTFTGTLTDLQRARREKDIQAYHQGRAMEMERHNRAVEATMAANAAARALKPPPLPRKTLQQAAMEKNLDSQIRTKNQELVNAAKDVYPVAGGDVKGNARISKLTAERDALMKQREALYAPAPPEMGGTPDEDEEEYPVPAGPATGTTMPQLPAGTPAFMHTDQGTMPLTPAGTNKALKILRIYQKP